MHKCRGEFSLWEARSGLCFVKADEKAGLHLVAEEVEVWLVEAIQRPDLLLTQQVEVCSSAKKVLISKAYGHILWSKLVTKRISRNIFAKVHMDFIKYTTGPT